MQRQLFPKAKLFLQQQHDLAREIVHSATSRQPALPGELQMCRAIGNLGMTNYQLAVASESLDKTLLQEAIDYNRIPCASEPKYLAEVTGEVGRMKRMWSSGVIISYHEL